MRVCVSMHVRMRLCILAHMNLSPKKYVYYVCTLIKRMSACTLIKRMSACTLMNHMSVYTLIKHTHSFREEADDDKCVKVIEELLEEAANKGMVRTILGTVF